MALPNISTQERRPQIWLIILKSALQSHITIYISDEHEQILYTQCMRSNWAVSIISPGNAVVYPSISSTREEPRLQTIQMTWIFFFLS